MKSVATAALASGAALWAMACAPSLPPTVLTQADQLPHTPALVAAQKSAPIAFAVAEKLRRQAHAAFDEGDFASAQLLAEQALVAYRQATIEARLQRAEQAAMRSQDAADKARAQLATMDGQQQTMAAEMAALNKRLQVLQHLELPRDSGKASAERARARAQATRTLHLQGQLLCSAARLLARLDEGKEIAPNKVADVTAAQESLRVASARLENLEKLLGKAAQRAAEAGAKHPPQAPIDHAMRARAACLRALTLARRSRADVSRAPGRSDALLAALAATGVGTVARDDRGVVVTLRAVFDHDKDVLSSTAEADIAKLAKVASTHGHMPLLVVLHEAKALDAASRKRALAQARALRGRLSAALPHSEVAPPVLANVASPVVDPSGRHQAQNKRVELVFVTPRQ
ncbi:MAG TPA: hypothetical protein ENK23_02690 [Sorangium sp.]|nr:hypothetical protein [Sorangium sp.]